MARLVIVSNRVASPRERGTKAGGVAVALADALRRRGGVWLGWSGNVVDTPGGSPALEEARGVTYATLDLSPREYEEFYLGYANATLWPLCHYRLGLMEFKREQFRGYLDVNERFAAALAPLLQPEDLVWVHDYHFIPLAQALRARGVQNRIGFFLHIPFPVPEVFTTLPDHETLLDGLRAYDLVGTQTAGDAHAVEAALAGSPSSATAERGAPVVQAFPIGIDVDGFTRLALRAASTRRTRELAASLGGRALIVGVDRLDYSKGLPQRFDAFSSLLARFPARRRTVTYLQVAPISRDGVAEYRRLRRELDQRAGRINGRYADVDWTPIRYLTRTLGRDTLAGCYRLARVGFVTPIRDGMNLVAKEFVAAQDPADPGALVLSRFAGAARELDGALLVNPIDVERVAEALDRALGMPLEERRTRWESMHAAIKARPLTSWRTAFLDTLAATRGAQSASAS